MLISFGFSAAAVTGAIIAPFLGRFLDAKSPKTVILIGIGIVTLSYFGLAASSNVWHFYFVVVIGFGVGINFMGSMAWHRCIIFWFDHWRGRAIALAVMGASLAGVLMPPLVTHIVGEYGWRFGYNMFAVSTALSLFPVVYFFMIDRPSDIGEVRDGQKYTDSHAAEQVEVAADSAEWTWQELLRTPAMWAIGVIFGSMVCIFAAVMLHLFAHLLDLGISTADAAVVLSVTALFSLLGKPVVGWLSDFWGARITIWLALACQGIALIAFTMVDGFVLALFAAALYGFGYSGMSPLRTFAVSTSLGSKNFAYASAILRWVELPFILLASPLAGYIHDVTGSYNTAFAILSGLVLFACLGPLFIREGGAKERRGLARQAD